MKTSTEIDQNISKFPATQRRSRRSREELNLQILTAATSLFASGGYKGVTIREIAKTANVTLPTVYRLFENKRDLYIECCRRELSAELPQLNKVLESHDRPEDILYISTEALFHWSNQGLHRIVMRAIMDEDTDMIRNEAMQLFSSEYMKNTLKAAQKLCNGDIEDAEIRVIFIHSLLYVAPSTFKFWSEFNPIKPKLSQHTKLPLLVEILLRVFPEIKWREVESRLQIAR